MRILIAILLCLTAAPAYAQKTKAAITTEINTNWPDNVTGSITPALLRSTVIDIVNSYLDAFAYGSPPVNSGSCGVATQVGGNLAGSFIATGTCSGGTYALVLTPVSPNGWICFALDQTAKSPTAVIQLSSTVTGASFAAITSTNDVIGFSCRGF